MLSFWLGNNVGFEEFQEALLQLKAERDGVDRGSRVWSSFLDG